MKEATRHCFPPEIVVGSETENLQILCRLLKVPLHGQCAHWKKLHLSQENTYPHCPASEKSARKYKGTQKGQKSSLAISLNFVLRLNHQLQVLDGQAFGSLEAQTYASLRPRIHTSMYLCIHAFIMHLFLRRLDCLLRLFSLRFQVIQLVAQQFLTTDSRNVEMKCGKLLS